MTDSWWDRNLPARLAEFESWTGDPNTATKRYVREHVRERKYTSVLDAGAGLCSQFEALRTELPDVLYTAVDSSVFLVKRARERGIDIHLGSVELMPWGTASWDFVLAQHVLEHLRDFRAALHELARVARHEACFVFFLPPGRERQQNYQRDGLWNNTYCQQEIDEECANLPRYQQHRWTDVARVPENGKPFDRILHLELR